MSLKDPNIVNARKIKRVAIVLSNPTVSTTIGWPVGFWRSELSHPYFLLTEKGYAVDVFSPNGGKCEADAMSDPRANGEYLASGKSVTGFANVEEDYADNAVWSMNLLLREKHVMPWRIEDELRKIGANYMQAGLRRGFAVRDGNLVTGQQNFSPLETADVLVRALDE